MLSEEDVRKITRLIGDIAINADSLNNKRCQLISNLSELIEADGWLWVVGGVDPDRQLPMQMSMLSGGLTNHQVAALLDSPSDTNTPSPCDQPMAELIAKGNHFVRTRQELVDDKTWYDNANTQTYFIGHGIDHPVYAITPLGDMGFSGIGFFRTNGRAPFSERQRKIIQIVTTEVRWLCDSALPERVGDAVANLTPRLRSVLTLLLDGFVCSDIAELFHLSPHTVKGYIRDIYRHFEINSQLELIRHFREN